MKLIRADFSKIRIGCSAKSSVQDEKLSCFLAQERVNTFTLKITRKKCNDTANSDIADYINPSKKAKIAVESVVLVDEPCTGELFICLDCDLHDFDDTDWFLFLFIVFNSLI